MWVEFGHPRIPGMDEVHPVLARRLSSPPLNYLILDQVDWIHYMMKKLGIRSDKDAIEFVIVNIDYPFVRGKPSDKHVWNAFSGKACYTITNDYWQTAAETLATYVLNRKLKGRHGYGDCEDTSVLITTMLRLLGHEAWEVFGKVYENGKLLGGHGWTIAKLSDGKWHLIESTLDQPPRYPDGYPVIDPENPPWKVNNVTYEPFLRFNDARYQDWVPKKTKGKGLGRYVNLSLSLGVEVKEKYEAISRAWGIKAKPISRKPKLAALRWRT